jgi:hypothetical protein
MSQKSGSKKKPAPSKLQNEGEGSRSAARRYDKDAEQAAEDSGHVKKAAQKAGEALAGLEAKSLHEAEERGNKHQLR